jgi:hypothetical protein
MKKKKKNLIIFITGLHNNPQGCGASVASAAGPFNKEKNGAMQNIADEINSVLQAC